MNHLEAAPVATSESAAAAYRTAVMLAISLPVGVTLFAVASRFFVDGAIADSAIRAQMIGLVWVGIAAGCVLGSVVAWRARVVPLLPPAGLRHQPIKRQEAATLQTGLLIPWALIEFAGMTGVLLYFFVAQAGFALVGGVAISWVGAMMTKPRKGWYGVR